MEFTQVQIDQADVTQRKRFADWPFQLAPQRKRLLILFECARILAQIIVGRSNIISRGGLPVTLLDFAKDLHGLLEARQSLTFLSQTEIRSA